MCSATKRKVARELLQAEHFGYNPKSWQQEQPAARLSQGLQDEAAQHVARSVSRWGRKSHRAL